MKRYMYIAVRRDLSHAQQVVQATHAAIEAAGVVHNDGWDHPSVVILGVKNEKELIKFTEYLDTIYWMHYDEFREPDRNNELTAVATFPVPEESKKLFKKFQLLK